MCKMRANRSQKDGNPIAQQIARRNRSCLRDCEKQDRGQIHPSLRPSGENTCFHEWAINFHLPETRTEFARSLVLRRDAAGDQVPLQAPLEFGRYSRTARKAPKVLSSPHPSVLLFELPSVSPEPSWPTASATNRDVTVVRLYAHWCQLGQAEERRRSLRRPGILGVEDRARNPAQPGVLGSEGESR